MWRCGRVWCSVLGPDIRRTRLLVEKLIERGVEKIIPCLRLRLRRLLMVMV